jgi:hypothetical protein
MPAHRPAKLSKLDSHITFLLAYGRKRSEEMDNREYLKTQIDELPDHIIEQIQEYASFRRFSLLGLFENDTD